MAKSASPERRAARAVNYDESEPDADDGWN